MDIWRPNHTTLLLHRKYCRASNTIRRNFITYPSNSRQIDTTYGAANSMDDILSRPVTIKDPAVSIDFAAYQYLGAATPVIVASTQADLQLTYLKQGTEPTGDAGDPYNGLDRFGRIQDQRWILDNADQERIQYGYTRADLKLWRHNTVAAALGKGQDEFFHCAFAVE